MTENTNIKIFPIEELGTFDIHLANIEVREGELKLSQHLRRERNSQIVKAAKERFKRRNGGRVFCEVCTFDFLERYGEIGEGYIEAHHKKPISKMNLGDTTRLDDFIMVCSNCHSMLHIGKEWISNEELKQRLKRTE